MPGARRMLAARVGVARSGLAYSGDVSKRAAETVIPREAGDYLEPRPTPKRYPPGHGRIRLQDGRILDLNEPGPFDTPG